MREYSGRVASRKPRHAHRRAVGASTRPWPCEALGRRAAAGRLNAPPRLRMRMRMQRAQSCGAPSPGLFPRGGAPPCLAPRSAQLQSHFQHAHTHKQTHSNTLAPSAFGHALHCFCTYALALPARIFMKERVTRAHMHTRTHTHTRPHIPFIFGPAGAPPYPPPLPFHLLTP